MKPTVSVIVPVFNGEKYLERCVDSILNQEYEDLELILVDDGSTDGTGEICRRYERQDPRVFLITKENSGVSDSRNLAIGQALGTYLQFVDSDDWLAPDATRLMVRRMEEAGCDLVIADFYRVSGERVSHKGDIEEDGKMSLETFASYMMENPADFYYGVLWNKLYRREIVERHHLRMDRNISWCEDFMFNLEYMRHAETICALRTPVYYYVKRKGSLVNQGMNISRVIRMKLMVFEYYNNFYKHVLDEEDYEKNRLQVYRFLVDSAGDGTVPPSILGRATRLGKERAAVSHEAVMEDGILAEAYRDRKLFEYYLEPVAIKCGLPGPETALLYYVSESGRSLERDELAELLNISRPRLRTALQRLSMRGMIRAEEKKGEKERKRQLEIRLLPAARLLEPDFQAVSRDYRAAKFYGFTAGEVEQYRVLEEKIRENERRVLSGPAKRIDQNENL
ncbi:MAG TPA: glycosyltransferase [Candidatus Lachnoclostridium pullistercoris]|uniref:Glycosyltransferase n=1 Tax=Candidatus Lachnoclostridium pullistercoris TaxID=2838632 RepID=A0A9D2PET1_9FIRM|nr:glycosyltransferase [Candidatus Lachnoclostridium pullistercoris]